MFQTNAAFEHLINLWIVLAFIFFSIPYLVYYFKSKVNSEEIKKNIRLKSTLFSIAFFSLFVLLHDISRSNSKFGIQIIKHPSEFFWISIFLLILYLVYTQFIWDHLFMTKIDIPLDLPPDAIQRFVNKMALKLGVSPYRYTTEDGPVGFLNSAYFTQYCVFIKINEESPKGVTIKLSISTRLKKLIGIISFLIFFPIINVVSSQIPPQDISEQEMLTWPFNLLGNLYQIDAVFWFISLSIIFVFFGLGIQTIAENFLLEFEDSIINVKTETALNIKSLKLKRLNIKENLKIKQPSLTIDDIKAKAILKKEAATAKLEHEKKERIEKVLGEDFTKKDDGKKINPEILRLDALIKSIRTILRATPSHRKVSIEDLVDLLSEKVKTSIKEVESIVIGITEKKEVIGAYDIWNKEYIGSSITKRFVDETLLNKDEFVKGLESMRVKSDGSVEFYFNKNKDDSKISNNKSPKK